MSISAESPKVAERHLGAAKAQENELREGVEGFSQRIQAAEQKLEKMKIRHMLDNVRLCLMQKAMSASEIKFHEMAGIVGACAKVMVKALSVVAWKTAFVAGNAALRCCVKSLPFISLTLGVALAARRAIIGYKTDNKAEYIKAVGELLSGAAACFPGFGTIASIGLDILMVGHDIYEHEAARAKEGMTVSL